MSDSIDGFAIRTGVITTVVLAFPLALAAAWVAARRDSEQHRGLIVAANVAVLVVFVLGAGLAAWVQTRKMPVLNAILTAVIAYLIIAAASSIWSLATGRELHLLRHTLLLTMAAVCGLIGGVIGSVMRGRGVAPTSDRRPQDS